MMRIGVLLLTIPLLLAGLACVAQTPDVIHATLEITCTRVLDGDTVEIRGGETVRLLGIDTPEMGEPYADDAKWALYDWVAHKTVRLEFDEEERDIYNRLLAFIYVQNEDDEWVLVNTEILRAGLATLLFIPPNGLYRETFDLALEEAQLSRRGIWGAVGGELTIADLEADLVSCMTEMVTVLFTVGEVKETSRFITLYSAEGDYGFYVKVATDLMPEVSVESLQDLVGTCVVATGIVDCERVGLGPSITLEYTAQLIIPCPPPDTTD